MDLTFIVSFGLGRRRVLGAPEPCHLQLNRLTLDADLLGKRYKYPWTDCRVPKTRPSLAS
jgi:hypothetical protein